MVVREDGVRAFLFLYIYGFTVAAKNRLETLCLMTEHPLQTVLGAQIQGAEYAYMILDEQSTMEQRQHDATHTE